MHTSATKPPRARDPRPRRPLMGGVAEGVLVRRRVLATPTRAAERLLAQDRWPKRVHQPLPPPPGTLSEPPGADPHAGWCGRGQGKPGLYPILGRAERRKALGLSDKLGTVAGRFDAFRDCCFLSKSTSPRRTRDSAPLPQKQRSRGRGLSSPFWQSRPRDCLWPEAGNLLGQRNSASANHAHRKIRLDPPRPRATRPDARPDEPAFPTRTGAASTAT